MQQLLTSQSLDGIPLLVLGNKNDLESACNEEKLCQTLELNSIKDRTVAVYSVSCKNKVNIDNVLTWLSKVKSKK